VRRLGDSLIHRQNSVRGADRAAALDITDVGGTWAPMPPKATLVEEKRQGASTTSSPGSSSPAQIAMTVSDEGQVVRQRREGKGFYSAAAVVVVVVCLPVGRCSQSNRWLVMPLFPFLPICPSPPSWQQNEHLLSVSDLEKVLGTSRTQGLSPEEVRFRSTIISFYCNEQRGYVDECFHQAIEQICISLKSLFS